MRPIVVLGAGSWGTALAIQFARGGGPTVLWGREEDDPAELARARTNARYLPGADFPPSLAIEPDLAKALAQGDDIVLVRAVERAADGAEADPADALAARAHRLGQQGLRALDRQAAAPGRARGARRGRADRRALRPDLREGSRPGAADRDRGRLARRGVRALAGGTAFPPAASAPTRSPTSSASRSAARSRTCSRSRPAAPTASATDRTRAFS